MVDDLHIEISKPFLLENKGGERIVVNTSNIKSTEIVNIDLITNKPLTVEKEIESPTKYGYNYISTRYHGTFTSIFDGYDESKSLKENYNAGYFDNMFQIETAPFYINYTQTIDTPRVWKNGGNQVCYSKYCTLTPEKRGVKFYTDFYIKQDHNNFNLIHITKTVRFIPNNKQIFWSIIY